MNWSWCDAVSAVATAVGVVCVISGGGWGLLRWTREKNVQKAEFLERLLKKFREREYEKTLGRLQTKEEDLLSEYDEGGAAESGAGSFDAPEFLVFLSYVCYLKNSGVINEKELGAFRCYIVQTLANQRVRSYLESFHTKHSLTVEAGPYWDLINLGLELSPEIARELRDNVNKGACAEMPQRNIPAAVTIDGKPYRTHVDILNGLFNRNLLAHMKGAYRLNDDTIVWFPRIFESGDNCSVDEWRNELLDDGKTIREYWPQSKQPEPQDKWRNFNRIVFAKTIRPGEGVRYRFKGVFRDKDVDETAHCFVYERIATSFVPSQFV